MLIRSPADLATVTYRETCLALESAEESGAAVSGVNRGVFGSLARHPRSRSSVSSRGGHAEI